MAASIDPSDYDAGCPRGDIRKLGKALGAYLAKKDPRGTQARRKNSSAVRGQLGVLRQVPEEMLVEELHRRTSLARQQRLATERQRRHRAKVKRGAGE